MPLELLPPGSRKGNPFYIIRGTVGGRRVEVTTKTRDAEAARRLALQVELDILDRRTPGAGEKVTFATAADYYRQRRELSAYDGKRLDRIVAALGDKYVSDITQADLDDAAINLFPQGKPATRNREFMRPAAAVLHYAADSKWCGWLRIKPFKEPRPKTRAVSDDIARVLIAAAGKDGSKSAAKRRLLLLWIFHLGTRISDTIGMQWEMVDLKARVVRFRVGKTQRDIALPLPDELVVELANQKSQTGRIFPWSNRHNVYRWLRELCKATGVRFTPHMARHAVGTRLNAEGAGLRTIMAALGHAHPQSSIRYQDADIEIVRAAFARSGTRLAGGKSGGEG